MGFILFHIYILGIYIFPTDELIFFRGVGQPPTSSKWFTFVSLPKWDDPLKKAERPGKAAGSGKGKPFQMSSVFESLGPIHLKTVR